MAGHFDHATGLMNVQMFFARGDGLGVANGVIRIVLIVLVMITSIDTERK